MVPELPKGTKSGLGKRWTHTGYLHRLDPTCWKTPLHKGKAGNWPGWQKDETVTASSMGPGMLCGSRLNPHWLGRSRRAAFPGIQVAQAMKATLSSRAPGTETHAPAPFHTKAFALYSPGWNGKGCAVCGLSQQPRRKQGKDWTTCAFMTFHVGGRNMGSPQNR